MSTDLSGTVCVAPCMREAEGSWAWLDDPWHENENGEFVSPEPFSEILADGNLADAEDRQLTGEAPHSASFHRRNRQKATHLSSGDRLPP